MTETSDVAAFRASVAEWLANASIPTVPTDLGGRFDTLRAWQAELHQAGFMGIHWPVESGGRGLSPVHHVAFYEELAAAGAPAPIGVIGLEVVGPSIVGYGTDEQRRRFLPPLLSGEEIWCQGFSEPEAGSDLASLRTRAVPSGDGFIVTGQKVWTSWAHKAQWCALLARTDEAAPKHAGISYLLVDMTSPGITVRPLEQMTGDAEFNEVFFDEVYVPVSNLLGTVNDGWRLAMDSLSHERGAYCLRRSAELKAEFSRLLAEMDGATLPDRHAEAIGSGWVLLQALEAQLGPTLQRIVAGAGPSPVDSMDKLLLNEVEQDLFSTALDLLGPGRGATSPARFGLDADHWTYEYLFSRSASIYGGTAQIQRSIVGERHLGLPR